MADHSVVAPMTGRVVEVSVNKGQLVEEGDLLFVIESMKMENEIFATAAGTVTEIRASADDQVSEGSTLMVIDV